MAIAIVIVAPDIQMLGHRRAKFINLEIHLYIG
jgi:hypothetical protein